jgi:hypothetical protein
MDHDRLRALLAELHRELGSAERLDAESRSLVEQVLQDLERLESPPTADAGLRDLVLRVESEHPRLAAAIGQVADALGRLGI